MSEAEASALREEVQTLHMLNQTYGQLRVAASEAHLAVKCMQYLDGLLKAAEAKLPPAPVSDEKDIKVERVAE